MLMTVETRPETKTTRNISGNLNPIWDEWVVFENSTWTMISVRVYDSDFSADNALSNGFTWSLVSQCQAWSL